MKVTYTIWVSEHEHHTVERTIDSWDSSGIAADFERALDLRELRAENHKLRGVIGGCAVTGCAICCREIPSSSGPTEIVVPVEPRDDGPHKRVWEYDGAYKCLSCGGLWGALSGKPAMPPDCPEMCESHECLKIVGHTHSTVDCPAACQ